MANLAIKHRIEVLDTMLSGIKKHGEGEMKAHLVKYFCICASGLLEESLKQIINDCFKAKVPKEVSQYISGDLKRATNLNKNKISTILLKFGKNWKSEFENGVTEEQSDSINSIIANRNQIAHGGSPGLSYRQMEQYYNNLKEVIELLQKVIK